MRINPYLSAAEHTLAQSRKEYANQQEVNAVSQPYFHKEIQRVEHPTYVKEIYKILKENKPVTADFVSKQLYNRNELTERARMMNEDRQSLSFNRKIPALTPTRVVRDTQTDKNIPDIRKKAIEAKHSKYGIVNVSESKPEAFIERHISSPNPFS